LDRKGVDLLPRLPCESAGRLPTLGGQIPISYSLATAIGPPRFPERRADPSVLESCAKSRNPSREIVQQRNVDFWVSPTVDQGTEMASRAGRLRGMWRVAAVSPGRHITQLGAHTTRRPEIRGGPTALDQSHARCGPGTVHTSSWSTVIIAFYGTCQAQSLVPARMLSKDISQWEDQEVQDPPHEMLNPRHCAVQRQMRCLKL
jgi:hypothetical protein